MANEVYPALKAALAGRGGAGGAHVVLTNIALGEPGTPTEDGGVIWRSDSPFVPYAITPLSPAQIDTIGAGDIGQFDPFTGITGMDDAAGPVKNLDENGFPAPGYLLGMDDALPSGYERPDGIVVPILDTEDVEELEFRLVLTVGIAIGAIVGALTTYAIIVVL